MIFYGESKAWYVQELALNHIACKKCEQKGHILMTTFARYVHIYGVPFAPHGKECLIACKNCSAEYLLNHQSQNVQEMAKIELEKIPTPLWFFTGFFLMAIAIICIITYNSQQ